LRLEITVTVWRLVLHGFLPNVKVMAAPLAGATVETEVEP
jgi:hypothetical protein